MGISQGQTMTLGEIIDALEKAPPLAHVTFDFCNLVPTSVRSWRGDYSELALGWSDKIEKTARDLLQDLKEAVGKSFQGYKGGDYIATSNTPVVVDCWRECSDTKIERIDVQGFPEPDDEERLRGSVLIRTKCDR